MNYISTMSFIITTYCGQQGNILFHYDSVNFNVKRKILQFMMINGYVDIREQWQYLIYSTGRIYVDEFSSLKTHLFTAIFTKNTCNVWKVSILFRRVIKIGQLAKVSRMITDSNSHRHLRYIRAAPTNIFHLYCILYYYGYLSIIYIYELVS